MVAEVFDTKELAQLLGVHPRKVGQAMQPVLDKLERIASTPEGTAKLLIMLGRQMLLAAELKRQRQGFSTLHSAL